MVLNRTFHVVVHYKSHRFAVKNVSLSHTTLNNSSPCSHIQQCDLQLWILTLYQSVHLVNPLTVDSHTRQSYSWKGGGGNNCNMAEWVLICTFDFNVDAVAFFCKKAHIIINLWIVCIDNSDLHTRLYVDVSTIKFSGTRPRLPFSYVDIIITKTTLLPTDTNICYLAYIISIWQFVAIYFDQWAFLET